MKYADIRNSIKSGDTLAWTHRKLRSWYDFKVMLVRLFQMSEYSHVGIAIVLAGRVWVLESVTPHPRFVPLSNLLPCYLVTDAALTDEQVERGLSYVGREDYDYSQWEAVKAYFNKNDPTDKSIQCAEFVNMIHERLWKATPSAVVGRLLENGSSLQELHL